MKKRILFMIIVIFAALCLLAGVLDAQSLGEVAKQEKERRATTTEGQEAEQPTEQPVEQSAEQPKTQWSEQFIAWSTTHYLHLDYTHPETSEWCAVLIVDNRTKEVACIK